MSGEGTNGAGRVGAEAFELKVGLAEMLKNGVIMAQLQHYMGRGDGPHGIGRTQNFRYSVFGHLLSDLCSNTDK
mgnify:CR=1 FL=1